MQGQRVSGTASFSLRWLALSATCRASWELPSLWQGLSHWSFKTISLLQEERLPECVLVPFAQHI